MYFHRAVTVFAIFVFILYWLVRIELTCLTCVCSHFFVAELQAACSSWNGWPAEKNTFFDTKNMTFGLFPLWFFPVIFFVTQLNAVVHLCFSHCKNPSTSLPIIGFTVSIPEGRSIDSNSLSMKSPVCYWRKETSFNRTDNSLLWFLLIALPLFLSINTISLPLCSGFCGRGMIGRRYRQQSEATAGSLFDDQWEGIQGTIKPQAL